MSFDDLGDRMKSNYENRTRYYLPRRTYTMLRVDGKNFHNYTKDCNRPYDSDLMEAMNLTAKVMCENISGAQIAFVQSDEISILITDFENNQTEAWFDGNLQKMCSIAAAMAAVNFYRFRLMQRYMIDELQDTIIELRDILEQKPPEFDCRFFAIPDRTEVGNYFVWRNEDTSRNSISMAAQSQFSHKQLNGKSCNEMQEMLWQEKRINWSEYPEGFKNGRCVIKTTTTKDIIYTDKRNQEEHTIEGVERNIWKVVNAPIFTQNRDWLMSFIPEYK